MPIDPAQAPQPQAPEQAQGDGNFSSLLSKTAQDLASMMEVIRRNPAASPEDKQNLTAVLQAYQAFQEGVQSDGQPQQPQGGNSPVEAGAQQVQPAL